MPTRKKPTTALIPLDRVQQRILILRGQRVILAADLASLYGVPVKRLNEQVRRNADRFPDDFVFQLTKAEAEAVSRSQVATLNDAENLRLQSATSKPDSNLKSQFATSSSAGVAGGWGGARRALPFAFTEHGAIMAANVLNSPEAVKASVFVVRAFVKLRELLSTHVQLAQKLDDLERKLQNHDDQIVAIIDAIRQLMEDGEEAPPKPPIGFHTEIEIKSPPRLKAKKK